VGDVDRGGDEGDLAGGGRLPEPGADLAGGPFWSDAPYMYPARRAMTVPANTFSDTAWARKPSGAITGTRPEATSSSVMIPFTPPKWSTWEWV
jgi:hypothetical protein